VRENGPASPDGGEGGASAGQAEASATEIEAAEDESAAADAESTEGDEGGVEYVEESVVVMRRGSFIALAVAAAALILALAAGNVYQWRKGEAAVASVDGSTITRKDYDRAVARGDGGDILDNLITRKLVERDAKKKGVAVTTDEVDARLKQAKAQIGSDADWQQALDQQHTTEQQVRDTFRLNLMIQKIVFDKIQVTDGDVQQFYDQNKDSQFQGKSLNDVKDQIKSQLTDDKQQSALNDYLNGLKSAAHITRHVPRQVGDERRRELSGRTGAGDVDHHPAATPEDTAPFERGGAARRLGGVVERVALLPDLRALVGLHADRRAHHGIVHEVRRPGVRLKGEVLHRNGGDHAVDRG
jgi:hypothetical protein